MPVLIRGLMLAQALALSAAPLMVFAGGLIGAQLHPDPRFATLPVAAMVSGTALAALPAARLSARLGRKTLFLLGMLLGVVSALGAALAFSAGQFWLFVASALSFGAVAAVVQQFRFAAMAAVPAAQAPVVASQLLLAGLVSAFLGPELTRLAQWFPQLGFAASFIGLSGLFALAGLVLWRTMPASAATVVQRQASGRSWPELLQQRGLLLAMAAGACGYGVMAYIMTATPLSMTQGMGYSLDEARWVIQSHIVAMFLPSLISGRLIRRFGGWWMIALGLVLMLVCVLVAWWDQTFVHYWAGLVLLGLAWNLLFVAGTALLGQFHRPEEASRVQGVNDFLVFGAQACAALASGAVVLLFGWHGLLLSALPVLLLLALALLRTPRSELAAEVQA